MKDFSSPPQTALRPPQEVMRLKRLGSMFPTRLSFLRVLTRRLASDGTPPVRHVWEMDRDGFGHAVYSLSLHDHPYSLIALSQPLDPDKRSDRVIATAWDAAFVLFDGVPQADDIARIKREAPKQEAGRFCEKDLVLSRANKSVRLWDHVVRSLRAGQQPDEAFINEIGYLMRTTAVYGNGKFGIADRALIADRPGFEISFMAEMLTVLLIRHFTHDLVEHVGRAQLAPRLKRHLGIGNATGLGMAPFLVTHPVLLNNWMMVRETALARVRALPEVSQAQSAQLHALHDRAATHLEQWRVPDPVHQRRIDRLSQDWQTLACHMSDPMNMEALWQAGQSYGSDLQELLLSLMLEPFGELVDGLAECLCDPFGPAPMTFKTTQCVLRALHMHAAWANGIDFTSRHARQTFWYVSEEKLEPRIGNRFNEEGADRESPLDIARRLQALGQDLPAVSIPLADFLTQFPDHLMAVERLHIATSHPYSEIRDNLTDAACLPIDMLRAKLSMFGATKFDPKSDLWTRITLAQGAPLAGELGDPLAQDWWCPVLE